MASKTLQVKKQEPVKKVEQKTPAQVPPMVAKPGGTEPGIRSMVQVPEHRRFRDDENPEEMSSPSTEPDASPPPVHHITRGDKVRHTAAYPLFSGVGIVTKISLRGDEVMVDFGSGVEWLDRKKEAKAS